MFNSRLNISWNVLDFHFFKQCIILFKINLIYINLFANVLIMPKMYML